MSVLDPAQPRSAEDLSSVLAADPSFAELSPAVRTAFLAAVDIVRLASTEILFRQGDAGDTIYYVVSGRLDVLVDRPNGSRQRLTQLCRGAYTGGMAMLAGRPRAATVRAAGTDGATLLAIPPAALDALAVTAPHIKATILERTARRLPMLHLAAMPLFQGLDARVLAEFNRASNWLRLPGGATLFRQNEAADCLFIVAHGRLEVSVEHDNGTREVVAHVGRGECIGEMAMLTGEVRFATVRALRDTELIRLSADECRRVLARRPRGVLALTQLLVARLRDTTARRRPSATVATIAVAPAADNGSGLHAHVAGEIVAALTRQGRRVLHLNRRALDMRLGAGTANAASEHMLNHRVLQWLAEQEGEFDHLVFECDPTPSPWSARCLRQADVVLFVAAESSDPAPAAHEAKLRAGAMGFNETPRELVLVHPDGTSPYGTERWLQEGRFTRHHHVREWNGADYERVARLVTGRAHGLVLGGGGARGFAHLGVLRAFEEARIPIDIIGGTSMGAVIAGQYVTGHSVDAMIDLTRRSFVDRNPITDYTIPLVSLISGGRMSRVLGRMFGDVHIEDLWRPYFCVATNLSRATVTVHREGPLKYAVATSIAVPGLAPPLIHRGDFLVDGGLLDNVPVAVMRKVSQGTVFAVDVSQNVEFKATQEPYPYLSGWRALRDRLRGTPSTQVPSMLKLLWRSTVLNSIHRSETVKKLTDVYIHPDLDGVEIFDWHALDKAVEVGYRAASEALETRDGGNATMSWRRAKWSSGATAGNVMPAARAMLLTETSASAI